MNTEHIRIFSGSPVITNGLKSLLRENNIDSLIKNQDESARLAGFGGPMNLAELFILDIDLEKAQPIIDEFKKQIA